jgi:hypothetical protein
VRYRLIACDVLTREIGVCLKRCPHTVDVEFSKKGAHSEPEQLRQLLQSRIDAVERREIVYDAVLLGFGVCGEATLELEARSIPVVIPRAHDCCTLLLGSRLDFMSHFRDDPSRPFHTTEYSSPVMPGRDLVEAYIDVPETHDAAALEKCRDAAARRNRHLEVIQGNVRLIQRLVDGDWDTDEFQVVAPHQRLSGVYDWDRIVTAKRA